MTYAIFCDFDGTITCDDVGKALLSTYGQENWQYYDQLVIDGKIGTREALINQWGMLRASEKQVQKIIEKIKVDPTFHDFYNWIKEKKEWLFVIVSDGFRSYIEQILLKHGVNPDEIEIKANEMVIEGDKAKLTFLTPPCSHDCANCKYSHVLEKKEVGYKIVYIGDGLSDIFPARELADIIFAKANEDLAERLKGDKRLIVFNDFKEVQEYLKTLE
ncbi:MAG: MtnX-like HAD-IB family phosphatase [Candidatus Heimdallarchaeaceae archaeon]